VGYRDSAFRHHANQVAIPQPIGDVPANAQLNDFSVEHPSAVDGITGDRFGRQEPLFGSSNLTGKPADALEPALAWTGVKHSGRGCTLSRVGFEQLTRPKSYHFRITT
jgi:hypothetical protein